MIEPYAEEAAAGRAVLVDGADVEGLDERGLFHLVNALKAEGGHLLLTARRAGHGSGSVPSPSPSRREDFYDRLSHIKAQAYQLELDTIREMLEGNEISLAQARTLRSNVYIMQSDNSER